MGSTLKWIPKALFVSALLLCGLPLTAALRSKSAPVRSHATARLSKTSSAHGHAKHGKTQAAHSKARPHGQQAIDSLRTLEIQQALIRQHYLQGEPTGEWDQATRDALVRLQEANHWQTKVIPDSRALIKLGLGPSEHNLLNPESAAMASANPGPDPSAHTGAN